MPAAHKVPVPWRRCLPPLQTPAAPAVPWSDFCACAGTTPSPRSMLAWHRRRHRPRLHGCGGGAHPLPGRAQDVTATRTHHVPWICERQGIPVLADRAYLDAGPWVITPAERPPDGTLSWTQRTVSRAISAARTPVERGAARLSLGASSAEFGADRIEGRLSPRPYSPRSGNTDREGLKIIPCPCWAHLGTPQMAADEPRLEFAGAQQCGARVWRTSHGRRPGREKPTKIFSHISPKRSSAQVRGLTRNADQAPDLVLHCRGGGI